MVCRDLRPANVLLGDRGHVLLTYFSQWNTVECRVSDQAIDGLYSAPGRSGFFGHVLFLVIFFQVLRLLKNKPNLVGSLGSGFFKVKRGFFKVLNLMDFGFS